MVRTLSWGSERLLAVPSCVTLSSIAVTCWTFSMDCGFVSQVRSRCQTFRSPCRPVAEDLGGQGRLELATHLSPAPAQVCARLALCNKLQHNASCQSYFL